MTKQEFILALAGHIDNKVMVMHAGRRKWNAACGQWLVYGFEQHLGFAVAADLEAAVETAYRNKKSVRGAVIDFVEHAVAAGTIKFAPHLT